MKGLLSALLAGPFADMRAAPAWAGLLLLLVLLLTAATQIGGAVLWLCISAFTRVGRRIEARGPVPRIAACVGIYLCAYGVASLAAVPLAGAFGRTPLDCGVLEEASPGPRSILTCLFNRHYVVLPAEQALQTISSEFSGEFKNARIAFLDAGFPFFDWFPILPHVSHGDGRKIDLALMYEGGAASPSPIGYWGFVQPRPGDPRPCTGQEGWLRWDMAWLQPLLPELDLDDRRTAELVHALTRSPDVRRVLIETHLRQRLGLDHPKIRFQGCRAARHDDHIHVDFDAN